MGIPYDPAKVYVVIYGSNRGQQAEDSYNTQQESDNQGQGNHHGLVQDEILSSPRDLFDTCMYLYKYQESITEGGRDLFRQAVANTRYYHSMFIEEIKKLHPAGVKASVYGKDQVQILQELRDLEQQVPEWEYRNVCFCTLTDKSIQWRYAVSSLFIALPSDLNLWDSSDPSTHRFQVHFLCDNWKHNGAAGDLPQHVHLSNHPGYSLKYPEEFFQEFGDYVLRVLQMIKSGYTNHLYEIPPLDTTKILWSCDPNVIGSHITKDTIAPLVDTAIAYLQELSPTKWRQNLGLTCTQSAMIKQIFLDLRDDDNAEGNLHRLIDSKQDVYWKCQAHAHQYLDIKSLEVLSEFVCGHGGYVDLRLARLGVELGSLVQANQFRALLFGGKHTFDIMIKLNWPATRSYVRELCMDIAKTNTPYLELDGITLDIHPLGNQQYRRNLFATDIIANTKLWVITLLNYPRPLEHCGHFGKYFLHFANSLARSPDNWIPAELSLNELVDLLPVLQDASAINTVAKDLQSALKKNDSGVKTLAVFEESWNAIIDLDIGAFVEVHSRNMVCPKGVLTSGSLRTLGVHLGVFKFDQEFFEMARTNTELQELNVSYDGLNVLDYTEHIVKMWHDSSSTFRLTLLDRMHDTEGRVVAQMDFQRHDEHQLEGNVVDVHGCDLCPPLCHHLTVNKFAGIIFQQWDCDHVFSQISDYSASFLDMATQQHSSALKSLTLHVSRLSHAGLSTIQEILCRSYLEHLHVVCTPVDSRSESISQILGSVQWSSLKSLVFSGNNIDEWIKIWPSPVTSRLLSLQIRGTWPNVQELSHSSVLFLQRLIFSSSLAELCLWSVQLQDKHDWVLVIDSMDLLLLETLDLGYRSVHDFISMGNAVDLLFSRIEADVVDQESKNAILVFPSFHLNVDTLFEHGPTHLQRILSYCRLGALVVECDPFDSSLSDLIAQVFRSVQWSTLKSLDLCCDNINDWIPFMANVDAPCLKSLGIWGSELVQQELTHSSVLIVERFIKSSPLEAVRFQHVQLQDTRDWVLLFKSMSLWLLEKILLWGSSHSQIVANTEAMELRKSRLTSRDGVEKL